MAPANYSLRVDGNALDLLLCLHRLRQCDGQQPILEGGGDFVLSHVFDGNAPFEPAQITLAEGSLLVFSFSPLLTFDGKDAVRKFDLHILLFEPGQFGDNLYFLVGIVDLKARPTKCPVSKSLETKRP